MEFLIMAAQLLLGLSILVGLHEMGHLLAAKAFGMRVEKFSIGFPPKIFGIQWGETEYSLGALPLGGFVKISGMIDESMDTEQMKKAPEPYEFRAKPAWQRLIVMMGGIIVNVITGIVIFTAIIYTKGESYYPIQEVNRYGINISELGKELGLKEGDKIIKINGEQISKFEEVYDANKLLESNSYYTVLRDNQEVNIAIPSGFLEKLSEQRNNFIEPLYPFTVGSVQEDSPAQKAGLQTGDKIVAVEGMEIRFLQQLQEFFRSHAGLTLNLKVERKGQSLVMPVEVRSNGTIGFEPNLLINVAHADYSLLEALPKGTDSAFGVITTNIKAFGKMFSGDMSVSKNLSGPVGIAKIFGGTLNWLRFWHILAMLSMVLAFMNFLPIPALDGGHVVFLTYEMISGRAPSDRFLENAQKVGMALLLFLMVFAFGNDLYKAFF